MSAVFIHRLRVTYADCTLGNHVYYGRYLDFLEATRGEFFRHLARTFLQWQEAGVIFPVLEVQIRYRGAARYDDEIAIEIWPTLMERVRLNFAYRISSPGDRLLLEAETHHVCTNLSDKPQRLPPELVAALAPYRRSDPGVDPVAMGLRP